MMDFETICYLENPKTGCTYVGEFLRIFCADRLLRFRKHVMVRAVKDKFYFLNVREPLDLYKSLYSYGLDGAGGVYTRLARAGHAGLYEHGAAGFVPWMQFMLDESRASLVDPDYSSQTARRIGLASYRFLRLTSPVYWRDPSAFQGNIMQTYEAHSIINAVVRFESLTADLGNLVEGSLRQSMRDVDGALAWLRDSPPINQSGRGDRESLPDLPAEVLDRLREKEALIYQLFYPSGPRVSHPPG